MPSTPVTIPLLQSARSKTPRKRVKSLDRRETAFMSYNAGFLIAVVGVPSLVFVYIAAVVVTQIFIAVICVV